MNNIKNLFGECVDCKTSFTWNEIKNLDYCPNCEQIWLDGKSNKYGAHKGIFKICSICKKNMDIINFRTIISNNGKKYIQNQCRPCQLIIRRQKNKKKFYHKPNFYLKDKNNSKIIIIKFINNIGYFNSEYLDKIKQFSWRIFKKPNKVTFYIKALSKNAPTKSYMMHQLIIGEIMPKMVIDHKNQNGLDNRKENLRIVKSSINVQNSKIRINNKSGFRGVYLREYGKWQAKITYKFKEISLGCYKTAKEAAVAYDKKAIELFGKDAALNFKL